MSSFLSRVFIKFLDPDGFGVKILLLFFFILNSRDVTIKYVNLKRMNFVRIVDVWYVTEIY